MSYAQKYNNTQETIQRLTSVLAGCGASVQLEQLHLLKQTVGYYEKNKEVDTGLPTQFNVPSVMNEESSAETPLISSPAAVTDEDISNFEIAATGQDIRLAAIVETNVGPTAVSDKDLLSTPSIAD